MLLNNVLTILKKSCLNNKFSCLVKTSKNIKNLLKCLASYGVINGYRFINSNTAEVFLRYDKQGKNFLINLELVSTPSKKISVNAISIKKIDTYNTFLISSDKAVRCLNKKKTTKNFLNLFGKILLKF